MLKLYYDAKSQPCRALLIVLRISRIPFTRCAMELSKGEHLTEKFKNEISRFQKVPAITHGDFKLTESVGILRYISREFNVLDHLYPKDSKLQARVDEYLEWQHNNIRAYCCLYFQKKWIIPKYGGEKLDEKELAGYEQRMISCIDTFERCWLNPGPFITGDKISAADIWAACELEQPRVTGFDPEKGRPVLSKWLNEVRQELSPYYEEEHVILNELIDMENSC